jgi:hypothetical protein
MWVFRAYGLIYLVSVLKSGEILGHPADGGTRNREHPHQAAIDISALLPLRSVSDGSGIRPWASLAPRLGSCNDNASCSGVHRAVSAHEEGNQRTRGIARTARRLSRYFHAQGPGVWPQIGICIGCFLRAPGRIYPPPAGSPVAEAGGSRRQSLRDGRDCVAFRSGEGSTGKMEEMTGGKLPKQARKN